MNPALAAAARSASGSGTLEGEGIGTGRAEHPVCGDQVVVRVRVADGRIDDLRWQARGCPATLAVAAVAHEVVRGQAAGRAAELLRARLGALGGLASHERHAERIFLAALAAAVRAAPPTSSSA